MSKKLEAKVKDEYRMGSVVAFSGHEYTLAEWREVPVGFEAAALVHPLLDVRDAEIQKEIKVTAKDKLAGTLGTADLKVAAEPRVMFGGETVATETEVVEEEPPVEKKPARRKSRSPGKEE